MPSKRTWLILFSFVIFSCVAVRSEVDNPLSLARALEIADNLDIEVKEQQLRINSARLRYDIISPYDTKSALTIKAGRRESFQNDFDDSAAHINITKNLFDKNAHTELALQKIRIKREENYLKHVKLTQKIILMSVFFDVVLSDLEFQYATEKLALSAVRERHRREDLEVDEVSELQVLEAKNNLEQDSYTRLAIESKQILTRAKLAELLGLKFPERPNELLHPDLSHYWQKDLATLEYWHELVGVHNLELIALKSSLLELNIKKQQENKRQIVVSGYLKLGEQSYQKDKEGRYKIGINADIALRDPSTDKRLAEIDLQIQNKALDLERKTRELNQMTLTFWLNLHTLKRKKQALETKQLYDDFYLEKARSEYEMNLSRDLGDAMVSWTKTTLEIAQMEFEFAITYQKLILLSAGYSP